MSTNQCDIGLIGLAVMGENLVLNMESKGFSVAAFNRTFGFLRACLSPFEPLYCQANCPI